MGYGSIARYAGFLPNFRDKHLPGAMRSPRTGALGQTAACSYIVSRMRDGLDETER
jgi:hypothetical protein